MNYPRLHIRVYDKAVRPEQAFQMLDLTFLYISFAIFFCQKKSRKSVSSPSGFSLKTQISGVGKSFEKMRPSCGDDLPVVAMRIYRHVRKGLSRFMS